MFNNGTGHQINGGTFYNVAGNLELRTHHLNIAGSTSGLGDGPAGSHPQLPIQDQEHEVGHGRQTRESGREWTVVARNLHSGSNMRPAPYDTALRPRRLSDPWAPMSNALSHYPPSHLHSHGITAPDNSATGAAYSMDHSCLGFQAEPVSHVYGHSIDDVSFHPGPPPSVHSGTFITAANVNFYGPKGRRQQNEGKCLLFHNRAASSSQGSAVQMNRY
ncbi:hypothetical protein B0H19DRAFT_109473 [Mycena capillaripes]|nr:hypothetical protein B0H19DRAFT_109473 [Mycena capillaripes]